MFHQRPGQNARDLLICKLQNYLATNLLRFVAEMSPHHHLRLRCLWTGDRDRASAARLPTPGRVHEWSYILIQLFNEVTPLNKDFVTLSLHNA